MVFILSAPVMGNDKRLVEASWWERLTVGDSGSSSDGWGHAQFSSVSVMSDSLWPVDCSMPGFPVHLQLPELTQTHVHWIGDAIQYSDPLLFPPPPAFSLSQHQSLFQWIGSSHQVAKVLEFQLQHHPSNEYSELISFRMDLLDLLVVHKTLKNLLQDYNLKASILQHSAFFIVQPHIYTCLLEKP